MYKAWLILDKKDGAISITLSIMLLLADCRVGDIQDYAN